MHIHTGLTETVTTRPALLTIGKFDGVHLGHQHLLQTVVQRARQQQAVAVALTFEPHPELVLRPQSNLHLLTTRDERYRLIAAMGIDELVLAPFDDHTKRLSATEYLQQITAVMPLRELWVGEYFALGRNREGNVARLRDIGAVHGFTVGAVPSVILGGASVNSSRVRTVLHAGDVRTATMLLGRPFALQSVVEHGDERGRTIGFPTANLHIGERQALPANGVYACWTWLPDGTAVPSVTNIGVRPTFDGTQRKVETHLLDWSGDLYGQTVRVAFVAWLRGEQKFSGLDGLKAQIARDAEDARALLAHEGIPLQYPQPPALFDEERVAE